ncbi:MAG: MoxR family ATPase [Candidatus Heimdallarchaeota archaeon]|jgi:MoxR-like ATPase|nr:MoxR family ATPase [Candidatus Heimdallarchaeota archaeon]MBY8994267.1 MoxR family ATPase [Candidatus Heimdallarchaeota archaeon]
MVPSKQVDKTNLKESVEAIKKKFRIIGRTNELMKALAAKAAGRHILMEGPVGVGKTEIAHALAAYLNTEFVRFDGDERYHPDKLVGHFDPPVVLEKGYSFDSFVSGPLIRAMQEGAILFSNEINRCPESTQNVLLSAMDEGHIVIPKLGEVTAKPGFFIIATQNPVEFIATTPLGEAIKDRFVWIRLDYQSEPEEKQIVAAKIKDAPEDIINYSVLIVRETRLSTDLRRGASIRGAIDLAAIINEFEERTINTWIDISIMALATKIELEDGIEEKIETVIEKLVRKVIGKFFRTA